MHWLLLLRQLPLPLTRPSGTLSPAGRGEEYGPAPLQSLAQAPSHRPLPAGERDGVRGPRCPATMLSAQ